MLWSAFWTYFTDILINHKSCQILDIKMLLQLWLNWFVINIGQEDPIKIGLVIDFYCEDRYFVIMLETNWGPTCKYGCQLIW